jgi:hypothetical protein
MRESEMTQNAIQHVASLDFEHITIYLMNNTNNHFNRDNEQRESTMSEQTIQSHGSNNNSNKRIQPKKNSRLKVGLTTLKQKLQRKKKNNTVILWLQDLPLELMMLIFSFLDCRDLVNIEYPLIFGFSFINSFLFHVFLLFDASFLQLQCLTFLTSEWFLFESDSYTISFI